MDIFSRGFILKVKKINCRGKVSYDQNLKYIVS